MRLNACSLWQLRVGLAQVFPGRSEETYDLPLTQTVYIEATDFRECKAKDYYGLALDQPAMLKCVCHHLSLFDQSSHRNRLALFQLPHVMGSGWPVMISTSSAAAAGNASMVCSTISALLYMLALHMCNFQAGF